MSDWRVAWTAWKGSAHRKLTGHAEDITSVVIGRVADRDVIVSAGGWTVCVWDPGTAEPIGPPLVTAAGSVSAMALGRVGGRDYIACACGRPGYQEVRVWDAVTRQPIGALPGLGYVDAIVLGRARDRDIIACADRSGHAVRIWDAVTGQPAGPPVPVPAGWYSALALARDGRRDVIAVAVAQPSVYDPGTQSTQAGYATTVLLDPSKAKLIGRPRQIDGLQSTMAMTYEPARDLVLCAGDTPDRKIRIWDARTGQPVGRPLDAPGAKALAFGRVGDRLILVSSHSNEATRFWDVLTGGQVRAPVTHDQSPQVLAVGRAGDRDVIVCGCEGYLEVMDWAAEDHPFGHTDSVLSLASGTVGDRDVIVSAAAIDDHAVWVWDAATGQPAGPGLPVRGVSVEAIAAGHAGDRDVVVTVEVDHSEPSGQIRFWDPVSGAPIGDPIPCGSDVAALTMSRVGDRDLIVAAAGDGVATWDAVTREAVTRLPFVKPERPRALALALAPGEPGLHVLCATALDREVIVHAWDTATWQLVSAIGIPVVVSRPAPAFAWLLERLWLVFVDQRDQNLHIRDAAAGSVVGPAFTPPAAGIHALGAGRAAGRDVVVTGGSDGTVTIVDAASGVPIGEPLTGHEGPVWAVVLARINGTDCIVSGGNDRKVNCWTVSPPA